MSSSISEAEGGRLIVGTPAPTFDHPDIDGTAWRLESLRGQRLLLSFFRFASCPFCNLRVHRMLSHCPQWDAAGLQVISVFESGAEAIRQSVGKQRAPFPILADKERVLYDMYRVERSKAAVARAIWSKSLDGMQAMARGFVPKEGTADLTRVPADFLIDEQGMIRAAHYGKDIGDHMPFERISGFAKDGQIG